MLLLQVLTIDLLELAEVDVAFESSVASVKLCVHTDSRGRKHVVSL